MEADTGRYARAAVRIARARRWRKCLVACTAAIALIAVISEASRAAEIPFREILLGNIDIHLINRLDSFKNGYVGIDTRFWDIYYFRNSHKRQFYYQNDISVNSLIRDGRMVYGFSTGRNYLSLQQDNVYTESDRMRGGRELLWGRFVLGYDAQENGTLLGSSRTRVLGTFGMANRFSGSIAADIGWRDRFGFAVRAASFPTGIEISEDILGHRFPFHFPFRVSNATAAGRFSLGTLGLNIRGGIEMWNGDSEEVQSFRNQVLFQQYSMGGSLSLGFSKPSVTEALTTNAANGSMLPGLCFSFDHHRSYGDVSMRMHDTRYMHLNNLEMYNTLTRLDMIPNNKLRFFVGWERIRFSHSGDSFFDTWPFNFLDMFESKRYRLGDADDVIDFWFIGSGGAVRGKRYNLELEFRFEWWKDKGAIRWLERKDILYPFFFEYVAHDVSPDISNLYAIQLSPAFSYRISRNMNMRLSASAMVPFGKEDTAADTGDGTTAAPNTEIVGGGDSRIHGGISARVALIYTM